MTWHPADLAQWLGTHFTFSQGAAEGGSERTTSLLLQPFSQKSRTATVPEVFQIGLCGVVEADIELFWDSWSAGFLGERLYVLDSSTRPSPIECSNVVHRQPPFSSILDETSRPHDLNGSGSCQGAPTPPVDRVRYGGWRSPCPRWHRSPPAPRQQRRRARALTVREAGPALAHCCLLRLGPKRPSAESLGRDTSKSGVVWCAD